LLFDRFFEALAEAQPRPRVEINDLAVIVNQRHHGVGTVTFRYFDDFPGAQLGAFVWLDEDRSSPHEEAFRDAIVFINSDLKEQRPERRVVAAKELMHVFDPPEQQAGDPDSFKRLLHDMENMPLYDDASPQYQADRAALWKAIVALIPPWLRQEYLAAWNDRSIKAPELATRWWVPENIVTSAMGEYYETMAARLGIDLNRWR
jgi:hypothetical protein